MRRFPGGVQAAAPLMLTLCAAAASLAEAQGVPPARQQPPTADSLVVEARRPAASLAGVLVFQRDALAAVAGPPEAQPELLQGRFPQANADGHLLALQAVHVQLHLGAVKEAALQEARLRCREAHFTDGLARFQAQQPAHAVGVVVVQAFDLDA